MGPNLNINQKNIREKTIKKLLIFFLKKHGQVLFGLASQVSPLDWTFILFLFTTRVDDISLILKFLNKNNLDNASFDLSRFQ